ncbi:MAG: ComEC/Rec2 family competence protein [Panacagrimonas sp.]
MFEIHMLPARHGDCLWVEYGLGAERHRMLIDCGPSPTYPALKQRIEALPKKQRHFELFVVSHVDDDHIGGSLKFLSELEPLDVTFGDVWFNAFPHLEGKAVVSGPDLLGAKQGEALSKLIVDDGLPWNQHFDGKAVVCEEDEELPRFRLDSGIKLTLLSPYWDQLEKMKKAWIDECKKAGLLPGGTLKDDEPDDTLGDNVDALAKLPFDPDKAPANGSSIAFIAEFDGAKVLFGADAYAPVLVKSLERMGHSSENPLRLAALKAPHHGSSRNFSRALMELAPSKKVLISTNGDKFKHPDMAAIARMVRFNAPDAKLYFNYETEFNRVWNSPSRQEKYAYEALYPDDENGGLIVRVT